MWRKQQKKQHALMKNENIVTIDVPSPVCLRVLHSIIDNIYEKLIYHQNPIYRSQGTLCSLHISNTNRSQIETSVDLHYFSTY